MLTAPATRVSWNMLRAFLPFRSSLVNRAIRWTNVRGLSEAPSVMKKRLMDDFEQYMDGRRNEQTVFHIMKMCSTGLRAELPRSRVSLADHVYTSMKDKGLPVNIQMYNSLLQVYLSNRHHFSPSEVLMDMREEGLIPNRGTLTLLLQGYCQQGNMTGAKEILSELKTRELTINEEVYGVLISGHAQSGDMESALGIIDIMKRSGLSPGLTAYSALLSGYAYHADIESIEKTIGLMKERRVFVPHNVFADMIDAMSRGGHHDRIPEILDMIRNKEWIYNELLNKAKDLATRGEGESSIHILNCLAQLSLVGEGQDKLTWTCNATLRNMALSDKPLEFLISCVDSFSSAGGVSQQSLFNELVKSLYTTEKWDQGRTVLLKMHERGLIVKPQYLYPPLADSLRRNDLKDHFQWLDILLNHFQFTPDRMVVDFTAKLLKASGRDVVQYLKEEGVELSEGIVKLISHMFCKQHQYEALYLALLGLDKSLIPAGYVLTDVAAYCKEHSPDIETMIDLFKFLAPSCDQRSLNSAVHKSVFGISHSAPGVSCFYFVETLLSMKIITNLSSSTCNLVLVSLNEKGLVVEFFEFLKVMRLYGIPLDKHHRRQIMKLCARTGKAQESQTTFQQMKEDGDLDSSIHSNLIIALCRGKKHQLALKHYQEFKDDPEYQLSFVAYSNLIQGFIYGGDLDSALKIRRKVIDHGLTPGVFMYNCFLEGYASTGDAENAQKEFDLMVSNNITPTFFSYLKLMQSYAHCRDVTNVRRVSEEAVGAGITISKEIVSLLVETCLAVNDLEAALRYIEKYSSAKLSMKTFIDFINAAVEQNETELTGRVVEILKGININVNTINHFKTFALLRCGRQEEAIDFASKEQLAVNLDLVNKFGQACQSSGNVESLRSLMKLLRELDVKPYMLHIPLIRAYARNNDADALLTITKELESCGETPKAVFHSTLTQLLKEQGREASSAVSGSEDNVASV